MAPIALVLERSLRANVPGIYCDESRRPAASATSLESSMAPSAGLATQPCLRSGDRIGHAQEWGSLPQTLFLQFPRVRAIVCQRYGLGEAGDLTQADERSEALARLRRERSDSCRANRPRRSQSDDAGDGGAIAAGY